MNRTVLIVGALIVVPLVIFLRLSLDKDPRFIDSPLVGREAPDFTLTDLDGQMTRLAELRGKPVMVNFWATWCPPCIVEHPVLVDAARRYAGRMSFVGVVYQDEPERIRAFLDARGRWGPALLDPDGDVAIAYGVYGAPETFFIDSEGTIARKFTGTISPGLLAEMFEILQ